MSNIKDFRDEELLKVLFEAKSIKVGLTKDEQKIDAKLPALSPSRRREVIGALSSKTYIYVDVIFPKNDPNSSSMIFPFPSNEEIDGISETGLDLINDILIEEKAEKKNFWTKDVIGWIIAIVCAIIGAVLAAIFA